MNLKHYPQLLGKYNCPLLFVFFILAITIIHAEKYASAEEKALKPDLLGTSSKTPEIRNHQPLNEEKINELLSLPYLQGYVRAPKHTNTVLYKKRLSESGANFYLSSGNSEMFLIDMKGNILHTWHTPNNDAYPLTSNAILLRNGDIILSLGYKGVVKMDKNSNILWSYPTAPHHDLDIDTEGNIYLITGKRKSVSEDLPILDNFIEVINSGGELLKKLSLYNLFKNYQDQSILKRMIRTPVFTPFNNRGADDSSYKHHTAAKEKQDRSNQNIRERDLFHANSVQVLDGRWTSKSPAFKKGNLLISLRTSGILIIVDPNAEKIEWLLGPKIFRRGQHDAQLLPNGNMLIFNNYSSFERSKVTEFDPLTQRIVWEYATDDGKFYSSVLGGAQRLPGGNTFIIQSKSGRAFEVTPEKEIVWEFYNPHSDRNDQGSIQYILMMQRLPKDFPLEWAKTK